MLDVIFKEFDRFLAMVSNFDGVSWTIYTQSTNEERIHAGGSRVWDKRVEENEDLPLLDEMDVESNEKIQLQQPVIMNDKQKVRFLKKEFLNRQLKEMTRSQSLYNPDFLKQLLYLVDVFTSIATCSSRPMSMVQRVANPQYMCCLLRLMLVVPPEIKCLIIKILQNLIRIHLPFEVFEEAANFIIKKQGSYAFKMIQNLHPRIKFEQSSFIRFLYNYLLNIRQKIYC